jgi:Ankyrin repeats (3 copies)
VRAAALLTSSSDVLEALLQAAPADALAVGETQHTLMKMCEAHKSHKGSTDCTAVQRRASLLVSRGACVNAHRPPLKTPLYSLAADGCAACVKYFIEELDLDIKAVFADSRTALHVAASGGHSSVVQVLLHAQTTAAGHTALHTAVAADKSASILSRPCLLPSLQLLLPLLLLLVVTATLHSSSSSAAVVTGAARC